MELSVTDAAIEGLRVARRNPGSVAIWAGVYLLGILGAVVLAFLFMGTALFSMFRTPTPQWTDETAAQMVGGLGLGFVVAVPILVIISAMLAGAVYRSVLHPDEKGFGFLKLGGDEFRLVGIMVIYAVVGFVFLGVTGGGLAGLCYALWSSSKGISILVGVFGGFAVLALWLWLGVRLSLANILTFAEHRIQVFESWKLTKGRFWPLLGMYLIVLAINFGVSFGASMVGTILQLLVGLPTMMATQPQAGATAADALAMAPAAIVVGIIAFVINMIAAGLQLVISYAPQAAIYKQLKGDDVSAVF